MIKTLIVGANGFLGNAITNQVIKLGWHVECIYNKNMSNIPEALVTHQIDNLTHLNSKYDVIFITAAFIPYGNLNIPDKRLLSTNVDLVKRISEQFPTSNIIFSSSVSVYGNHSDIVNEKSSIQNPSLYGFSKLAAEFILKFHSTAQIIRFSSLYGLGMSKMTFLPRIIENAKSTGFITLFGDGQRKQDYLHVDDAARLCIAAAMSNQSDTYLGVYGVSYSNIEVANIIRSRMPNCTINYTGEDNTPSSIYNNSYTKHKLNFSPIVSIEEGLNQLIDSIP